MPPPLGRKELRWARTGAVTRLARTLNPDAIIERYYNFGGEGILAGAALGKRTMLEVNAPVIDYPGSNKARLDRMLLVEPMRRWRERICRRASVIVTPSAAILPPATPSAKILELEWGADTTRFHPGAKGSLPFSRPPGVLAVFAGAFRRWHGAERLLEAMRQLRHRGIEDVNAVLVGDGPELPRARIAAQGLDRVTFTGPVAHAAMPACLAAADIGVAPFTPDAHGPLALGFYWSPLKIFEYMASGLPTVTIPRPPLTEIVRDGQEGLHAREGDPAALAEAIVRLAADPALRQRLGASARARVVERYSWARHCEQLERVLLRIAA